MNTKYEAMKDALNAMVAEFRGYDLPYGSKAYAAATTALNMPDPAPEPVAARDINRAASAVLAKIRRPTDEETERLSKLGEPMCGDVFIPQSSDAVAVPEEWRDQVEQAISRASVFDDGSDGADAESARSVVGILRAMLAAAPQQQDDINVVDLHPEAQQPERECPICNGTGYNSYPLSDGGYIGGRCACTAKKKPKQPGQLIAWERRPLTIGCKRFMTQAQYDAQSDEMKANYQPFKCASCEQPAQALTDFDIVTMANRIIDYSFICDGGGPTELASDEARQAGLIEFARVIEARLKGAD